MKEKGKANPMRLWYRFFGDSALKGLARSFYAAIAEQSREVIFYRDMHVPDSLDGRFEMLCLHAFLVFRQLKNKGKTASDLSQEIYDEMFRSLDNELRELGVADMGVGRRIKAMTEALNGRVHAYEKALVDGKEALRMAIRRNVFGTVSPTENDVESLVKYFEKANGYVSVFDLTMRMEGGVRLFPEIRELSL